jgi:hypothetical protein
MALSKPVLKKYCDGVEIPGGRDTLHDPSKP